MPGTIATELSGQQALSGKRLVPSLKQPPCESGYIHPVSTDAKTVVHKNDALKSHLDCSKSHWLSQGPTSLILQLRSVPCHCGRADPVAPSATGGRDWLRAPPRFFQLCLPRWGLNGRWADGWFLHTHELRLLSCRVNLSVARQNPNSTLQEF